MNFSVGERGRPKWNLFSFLFNSIFVFVTVCCEVISNSSATPWTVAHPSPLWDLRGKDIRVGCHFLLQGIFLTQGSNPRILHWQADSLPLSQSVFFFFFQLYSGQ